MKDALSISPPRSPPSLSSAAVLWCATGRAGAAGNVGAASPGGGPKLRLTLIAKATYAWAHGGPMSPVAPEPLRTEDQTHGGLPARSVESPAETAPLLRACDVIFTGSAILPGGQRALTAAARIGLFSDRRPVLDKTVHVLADRKGKAAPEPFSRMPIVYERAFGGPGQENPVGVDAPCIVDPQDPRRAAGFGAISRFWRPRKKLVEALDRGPLEKPIQEIAEDFPWAYFQAAPADQQIGYLAGGEWLVLDGLHPELPRVQTQIPFAQAKGRVRAPNGALADVPMVADMLLLRGDTATASIVWRGTIEIPFTAAELSEVRCAVALESPGAPAMLDGLLAEPVPKGPVNVASAAAPAAPAAAQAESTLTLAPASQAAASARSVAPFEVKAAGTGRVTADVRATPWSAAPLAKTPEAFGEGTLALGGSSAPLPPALFGSPQAPSPAVIAPPSMLSVGSATPGIAPPSMLSAGSATPGIAPPERLSPALPDSPPPKVAPRREEAIIPKTWSNEGWTPPPRAPRVRHPNATGLPPQAIAGRLRAAGMDDDDVRELLLALDPPPPPPDED